MQKRWVSLTYAFYKAKVSIGHDAASGRRFHTFACSNDRCKTTVKRYLDRERGGLGNLAAHARSCWGKSRYESTRTLENIAEARAALTEPVVNGTIRASFKRQPGKVTYSHMAHTDAQTR